VSRGPTLALIVAAVLALPGCGGGDSNSNKRDPAKDASYARAAREMNHQAYDDALKRMRALDGYRDAAKRLEEFKVRAARETLANAKRKNLRKAPRAAMSLAKTSLKYHPTAEARAFYRRASRAHDEFKRKQQAAGHF
jgi:hypothetical protein